MIREVIKRMLIRLSGTSAGDRLVRLCRTVILGIENGSNHNIISNGELRSFLSVLEDVEDSMTVFDVGANVGDWTLTVVESIDVPSQFHLFEIVPATFEELNKNVHGERYRLNNFGLSDEENIIDIHYYPESSTGSSIVRLPWTVEDVVVKCKVMTGDKYCAENYIERIDFLKIDAEGMDYRILQGFRTMLENGNIETIQFELNKSSILTKKLLIDFYNLLVPLGYEIGRIYPTHTRFKKYELITDEMLVQGNYIARFKTTRS